MEYNLDIKSISQITWKYMSTSYLVYFIILTLATIGAFFIDHIFVVFGLAIILLLYWHVRNKAQHEFMKEFASAIGFTYIFSVPYIGLKGNLFAIGHDHHIIDVMFGSYKNIPMRIFVLTFIVGYGKEQQKYSCTVFETTFQSNLPEIFVSAKAISGEISIYAQHGEALQLEGNFNSYFKVYVPKGKEMEALELLTPNVMADLIDKASKIDFEFCENKMYLYVPKVINTQKDMQSMFDLTDYLVSILHRNISEIK